MSSFRFGLDLGATKFVVSSMENDKLFVSGMFSPDKRGSTPQLTVDDLLKVLSATQNSSTLRQRQGKSESLVVAIPEVWYQNADCPERRSLEHLLADISTEPGHWSVVSQAIAAASYWLIKKQQSEYQGNLLICDMGGSTFDVHLCHISQNKRIKVLYSDHSETAGLAFDVQCVQLAYTQKHGHSISEDDPAWGHLLEYFEAEKIKSHVRSSQRLLTYLKAQELMAEYNLYCFGGGYAVKCQQVREAFTPVEEGIQEITQKLQTWMHDSQQRFDQVMLIGGFCKFPLTQRAIQQALGLYNDDPRWSNCLDESEKLLAITYGACLIANHQIEPVEKFPYTLGIVGERLNAHLEKEQEFIPLILSGTNLQQLTIPRFADMFKLNAFQECLSSIEIWIDSQQHTHVLKTIKLNPTKLANFASDNIWRLGMRINPDNALYLIIRDEHLKQQTEYELGKLSELLQA